MSLPRRFRFAGVTVAALSLAACGLLTDASDAPVVSAVVQGTTDDGIVPPSATLSGRDIVLRGTLSTPCLGYGVRVEAKNIAGGVEVTMRGRQEGELCLTAIGRFVYQATIFDLPAGRQRVVVRHVIDDANWAVETPIDTTVTVP